MTLRTVRILLWLPLAAFLLILALVSSGLIKPHDAAIHSQMVGRPVPAFDLASGRGDASRLRSTIFADGKPKLLNFFASWCIPCVGEAPQLLALKQAGVVIEGVAVRDRPIDLASFLQQNGDPYDRVGLDDSSAVQVELGSSGVPETFLVDGRGVIRLQHIGAIGPQDVADILAAIRAAR
jgi:cytochrome c biogenesis protein CcmG, thiol:disulfide interchange protein DsbE